MSSDESEIEMHSALPAKTTKKPPRSPSEDVLNSNQMKKTTKIMIHEALSELKTRKGVSVYAIKKYITDKYNLDLEKTKYLIKKQIKTGVADGTIIQMKGVGATGSFKLAPVKETKKKQKKSTEKPKNSSEKVKKSSEKMKKSSEVLKKSSDKLKKNSDKSKNLSEKTKSTSEKLKKSKAEKTMEKDDKNKEKIVKPKSKSTENKLVKKNNEMAKPKVSKKGKKTSSEGPEKVKTKIRVPKEAQTPAKKRAMMMKRKSIGSIIKPPKMKPKAME